MGMESNVFATKRGLDNEEKIVLYNINSNTLKPNSLESTAHHYC